MNSEVEGLWEFEPISLPTGEEVFKKLRDGADNIFGGKSMDEWLQQQVDPHVLEVGEMNMTKDLGQIEEDRHIEDLDRYDRWNQEIGGKIEDARDSVMSCVDELRAQTAEVEWRVREEEVSARERLTYEHQAQEAQLLSALRGRRGSLLPILNDKFSWTIEWRRAPQEFQLNVTSIRGMRGKLRDGYYVVLASIIDRLSGQTLRFSTGEHNLDCCAALPPIRHYDKSSEVDRVINQSVDMLCPAAEILQTHAILLFEVWQLKVGKYDPIDEVVGWGAWPLVNKDFLVVEGKFKVPLMKGEVNPRLDTYESIATTLQDDLNYWLGNLYFEIKHNRKQHQNKVGEVALAVATESATGDWLRLEKTVDDYRELVVPKLPPRLFYDEVSGSGKATQGLRRRYFNNPDLRPLNAALWEKRALLEEEKTALQEESMKRKSRAILNDEDEEAREMKVRRELMKLGVTKVRRFPQLVFAEEELPNKDRDSHVVTLDHHTGIMSQREFFFLGRRYRDRIQIAKAILLYDLGINLGGPWDKGKVIENLIFCFLGLCARAYVHGIGLYLCLTSLSVPVPTNEWGLMYVDIRFAFTTRFFPQSTLMVMFSGTATVIGCFIFISVAMFGLIRIFQRLPYVVTRFWLWYGAAAMIDPFLAIIQVLALGNTESGDPLLLCIQMLREERNLISGLFLSISCFACFMLIQAAALYQYCCFVHLNGRVDDVYNRIVFPESSFFIPHDLEISNSDLLDEVKLAKNYRNEAGTIKTVRVYELNHHQTCFFRARLFKLLCVLTNEPDEWVSQYIDAIPLRRPLYVKDLITHNLGSYKLGDDILEFMKRNFPHMTNTNSYRVGDINEDFYYEADLMHDVQMRMTPHDDDQEMRRLLKAYFHAQVYTGKPVEWDLNDNKKFVVKDTQMLADLIFFETSSAMIRSLFLSLYLHSYVPNYFSIDADDPNTSQVADMPNFDRTKPLPSMNGLPVKGSIVHIVLENPVKKTKQLSRSFVATPFGVVIEAKSKSFSFLAHHTADHPEFWAAKAILMDFKKASEYLGKDDSAASELVLDTTDRRGKKA
jgi:hypothetical protein